MKHSPRILMFIVLMAAIAQGAFGDEEKKNDPIESELLAAIALHDASVQTSVEALTDDFQKQIKSAAASGRLDSVEVLQKELSDFKAKRSELPETKVMQIPKSRFEREMKQHYDAMIKAFDRAIVQYTKEEKFEEAKSARTLKLKYQEANSTLSQVKLTPSKAQDTQTESKAPVVASGDYGKGLWNTIREGRRDVFYEAMIGQYNIHFKGNQPFYVIGVPKANLWTEQVQRQLRGSVDLANMGCSGRGWLIIPKDDTYTIISPSDAATGFIEIDGKSPGYNGGDIDLKKGIYDLTYKAGTYGRDELSKLSIKIVHKKSKQEIPIVVSEYEIVRFLQSRVADDKLVDLQTAKLKRVSIPREQTTEIEKRLESKVE